MFLYTKKGDTGKSKIGKKKISKDNKIIDLLGSLDELNCLIGLVKNYLKNYRKQLQQRQEELFIIQANVAYLLYPKFKPPVFSKDKIDKLEKIIEEIERQINLPSQFVIPGKELNSAWFHFLRAYSRKVERKMILATKRKKMFYKKEIWQYLNRLSSYFYALALKEVYLKGLREDHPHYL